MRKPDDIAQVCLNGHTILVSVKRHPSLAKNFCKDCGAATIEACPNCRWPIEGAGEHAWMGGGGPYQPPRFCENCSNPFPWTEAALIAAKEYADEIDLLNHEEKLELKGAFDDLSKDTIRTPLGVSRFQKLMVKAGPAAQVVMLKFVEVFGTVAANKIIGGQ